MMNTETEKSAKYIFRKLLLQFAKFFLNRNIICIFRNMLFEKNGEIVYNI